MSSLNGGRRTEFPFTASLATIDSETPNDEEPARHAGTWDTETDHLLSYFLGGAESQGPPTADFASTTSSNASTLTAVLHPETEPKLQEHADTTTGSFLPPTPAVQFFAHHPSGHVRTQNQGYPQQHQASIATSTSQSSSSSSLSSMAAALVSGVSPGMLPGARQQVAGHRPQPELAEMSPISPAALIGNGQENLFLPGPDGAAAPMGPPAPREPRAPAWPQPGNVPIVPSTNAPGVPNPYAYHWVIKATSAPPESEEKRAKRLERNRVSARKSRRKKKERLETLSQAVNQLHDTVEHKRRDKINAMVPAFVELRATATNETVMATHDLTSPHSLVQRAVLEFQYAQLKNMTLPGHQKLMLWLTLQPAVFFKEGKDVHNGNLNSSDHPRVLGKVSSKQIGEELTKCTNVNKVGANDNARWWPLFCFEMKFSVDQEERLVKAIATPQHQRSNSNATMGQAVETADRLGQAMNSLSHLVARREEKTLAILTPVQMAKLQQRGRMGQRPQPQPSAVMDATTSTPRNIPSKPSPSTVALHNICQQLNQVLQISTPADP